MTTPQIPSVRINGRHIEVCDYRPDVRWSGWTYIGCVDEIDATETKHVLESALRAAYTAGRVDALRESDALARLVTADGQHGPVL